MTVIAHVSRLESPVGKQFESIGSEPQQKPRFQAFQLQKSLQNKE
jgi:hypothetical protein